MIWSSATKHRLQKIHRMQNRAVRNVLNARFNAPSTPIYKQLGIPKFNDIAKMYSYVNSYIIYVTCDLSQMTILALNCQCHGMSVS